MRRPDGGVSGGFGREMAGEDGDREVRRDRDELRRICGVSYGFDVAGEGGEGGDCELGGEYGSERQ